MHRGKKTIACLLHVPTVSDRKSKFVAQERVDLLSGQCIEQKLYFSGHEILDQDRGRPPPLAELALVDDL